MGSIPNGSAPLQACARLIFILRYRAAPGRRKFVVDSFSSNYPGAPQTICGDENLQVYTLEEDFVSQTDPPVNYVHHV